MEVAGVVIIRDIIGRTIIILHTGQGLAGRYTAAAEDQHLFQPDTALHQDQVTPLLLHHGERHPVPHTVVQQHQQVTPVRQHQPADVRQYHRITPLRAPGKIMP